MRIRLRARFKHDCSGVLCATSTKQRLADALETLVRGEERTRDPGELAVTRGQILAFFVTRIPAEELGWPGGPRAALEEGLRAFEDAVRLGHPHAAELWFGLWFRTKVAMIMLSSWWSP